MTEVLRDAAVRDYLAELRRLLEGSPDRELVVDGVIRHIEDALADGPVDRPRVQAVLEELGDPAVIAAEATPGARSIGPSPALVPFLDRRGGAVLTAVLLAVGGYVVPFAGWIAGVVLLWCSHGWRVVDKVVGTLAPLIGVALVLGIGLLVPQSTSDPAGPLLPYPSHLAVLAGPALGAIASAVYLLVRFRPRG